MSTPEREGNRLACPNCLSADFIGEIVTGWREIQSVRMVDGRMVVDRVSFGRVEDAEHEAFFCSNEGCNVDVEIPGAKLVQIDRDGKRVVVQPDVQGTLITNEGTR